VGRQGVSGQSCWSCGCRDMRSLILLERVGVPPGEKGHDIGYSHLAVFACPACSGGQVEKRDHDCFDFEEVWDQYEWCVLDPPGMRQLADAVRACRRPLDPECRCAVHEALRASCRALPSSYWSSSLEADSHVHRVSVVVEGGRPVVRLVP